VRVLPRVLAGIFHAAAAVVGLAAAFLVLVWLVCLSARDTLRGGVR
jgi:hypothetical protein